MDIAALIAHCIAHQQVTQAVIAYSGGLDSTCLLHALHCLRATEPGLQVRAVHINHQLSPHAQHWQQHCQQHCQHWSVPFESYSVTVQPQGQGLEAAARTARYQALAALLRPNDHCLTGHHLDDQIETFFLRLLRGSGLTGLSAMAPARRLGAGWLVRPLLAVPKAQLEQYAQHHRLQWIEDESNQQLVFDRNFLRHHILPQLAQRWPQYPQRIHRAVQHIQQANLRLQHSDQQQLKHCLGDQGQLCIQTLQQQSLALQQDLFAAWLRQYQPALPSYTRLCHHYHQFTQAGEDRQPCMQLAQGSVRRYQHQLYWLPMPTQPQQPGPWRLQWQQHCCIEGRRWFVQAPSTPALADSLLLPACTDLRLRRRQGGESFRRSATAPRQRLKKWLQAQQLPPWQRDQLLLLYVDQQLYALYNSQAPKGQRWQRLIDTPVLADTGLCIEITESNDGVQCSPPEPATV